MQIPTDNINAEYFILHIVISKATVRYNFSIVGDIN